MREFCKTLCNLCKNKEYISKTFACALYEHVTRFPLMKKNFPCISCGHSSMSLTLMFALFKCRCARFAQCCYPTSAATGPISAFTHTNLLIAVLNVGHSVAQWTSRSMWKRIVSTMPVQLGTRKYLELWPLDKLTSSLRPWMSFVLFSLTPSFWCAQIDFRCLHCEMLFMSLSLLKSHIEEKHCEVFYKCTICPVAFKSSEGCRMHVKNKHVGSEPNHQ